MYRKLVPFNVYIPFGVNLAADEVSTAEEEVYEAGLATVGFSHH